MPRFLKVLFCNQKNVMYSVQCKEMHLFTNAWKRHRRYVREDYCLFFTIHSGQITFIHVFLREKFDSMFS